MSGTAADLQAREQVVEALREAERFLLVTHEHPDGDAIGSLLGMHGVLTGLGKDAVMFIAADEFPLPYEYDWLDLSAVAREVPADLADRTVVFLDCGTIERNPVEELRGTGAPVLNIDHHHDNTHFGSVNLVAPEASCTAEIVWELALDLEAPLTPAVAEALYVGLITDTGQFMYENTSPRAHEMAAGLIAAGVDVALVYRRIYEGWPEAKIHLFARALAGVERACDGALTLASLTSGDFAHAGAEDSHTEGIVDLLRAVRGTKVAALARERTDSAGRVCKVSLRSSDGEVDVSVIARAAGGGGHRAAAGFTTDLPHDDLLRFLGEQVDAQL